MSTSIPTNGMPLQPSLHTRQTSTAQQDLTATTTTSPQTTVATTMATTTTATASPSKISAQIDLAITLILHTWPALTTAVQNQWGGPTSADKRDWLAGHLSDLFASRADTDEEDVEEVLFYFMGDEFDTQLEDESEVGVAALMCNVRRHCLEGDFRGVEEIRRRWERMGGDRGAKVVRGNGGGIEDDDDDGDESDGGVEVEEPGDADGDVQMGDGVEGGRRREVEVDEDGFTKVVGRRKR